MVLTVTIAFDPRPFIRNFEAAVDKLLDIRKDIQKKTEMLEKSVKSAEEEYNQKMVELNSGFEVRHRFDLLLLLTRTCLCSARLLEDLSQQWRVRSRR
jgi:hypothetical protein